PSSESKTSVINIRRSIYRGLSQSKNLNHKLRNSDPVRYRTCDQRSNSAMAMVAHLHHFFNAETCQSSLHTLRCEGRPLQCPGCQSLQVGPWGGYHAQPGLKRYQLSRAGLQAPLQGPHGYALGWQQALGDARDAGDLAAVPVVCIAAYCPRGGR